MDHRSLSATETERRQRSAPVAFDTAVDLHDPRLYINRELSWLAFNQRVLDQALDESRSGCG